METKKFQKVCVNLTTNLFSELKRIADREYVSVSDVIRMACRKYVNEFQLKELESQIEQQKRG